MLTRLTLLFALVGPLVVAGLGAQEMTTAAPVALGAIVLRPTVPAYYTGCDAEEQGSATKAMCSAAKVNAHIARTLVYPELAREDRIEGVVVVSFVVDPTGGVQSVKILRDIGSGCGAEARRVIEAMPKWEAASYKGVAVSTQFTLPINFSLKRGMFDYQLLLGGLPDGEVYQEELIEAVTAHAPVVTGPQGDTLRIAEVVYTFERGGDRREFVASGSTAPERQAFARFVGKKPGRLTVEANVLEGFDIRAVTRGFTVVR